MNTKTHVKLLKLLCLSTLTLMFSGCVTIQDGVICSVAGDITQGAICTHLLTAEKADMNMDQFIDFLTPNPNTGKAGAQCMSDEDWSNMHDELELACRLLGKRCSKGIKQLLNKTATHAYNQERGN